MLGDLFQLLVLVLVGGGLWRFHQHSEERRRAPYLALQERWGGELLDPRPWQSGFRGGLEIPYRGGLLRLTRTHSGGRSDSRVEFLEAEIDLAGGNPEGRTLRVSLEGAGSRMLQRLGGGDLEVGDPAFDARYLLEANDPAFLGRVLIPEVRERLDGLYQLYQGGAPRSPVMAALGAGEMRLELEPDRLLFRGRVPEDHGQVDRKGSCFRQGVSLLLPVLDRVLEELAAPRSLPPPPFDPGS